MQPAEGSHVQAARPVAEVVQVIADGLQGYNKGKGVLMPPFHQSVHTPAQAVKLLFLDTDQPLLPQLWITCCADHLLPPLQFLFHPGEDTGDEARQHSQLFSGT